ncbi:MAG: hypothetical protein RRZ68_03670 [Oscillospiraceae bacterium]
MKKIEINKTNLAVTMLLLLSIIIFINQILLFKKINNIIPENKQAEVSISWFETENNQSSDEKSVK